MIQSLFYSSNSHPLTTFDFSYSKWCLCICTLNIEWTLAHHINSFQLNFGSTKTIYIATQEDYKSFDSYYLSNLTLLNNFSPIQQTCLHIRQFSGKSTFQVHLSSSRSLPLKIFMINDMILSLGQFNKYLLMQSSLQRTDNKYRITAL